MSICLTKNNWKTSRFKISVKNNLFRFITEDRLVLKYHQVSFQNIIENGLVSKRNSDILKRDSLR